MRAEELLKELKDEELVEKANACFAAAEPAGTIDKTRLLAEADLYLKALARREDSRTSERDFKLEIAVIVLISVEIALSLIFGFLGLSEGSKQGKALDDLNKSTAATAVAMATASDSIKAQSKAQAESLVRLNQMSDTLRDSLRTTNSMAAASRKQLEILKQEQDQRAQQLARKPKLQPFIGEIPLEDEPFNAVHKANYPISEETDISMKLNLRIQNRGNATANNITFRVVVFARDVTVQSSEAITHPNEPPDNPAQTFIITIEKLRQGVNVPMTVTFTYAKGHEPFVVSFVADADEIEHAVTLGSLSVAPRKPAR
jgi:hypothetical protein